MTAFEHSRFEIFNAGQHPLKHTLADFGYSNPALGSEVTNLEQAMDWVMAVLYPNTKDAVDTVGDLPAVGNSVNDMRVVLDDGDGKAATYRWEQREGDVSAKWYKIYDMDWGYDSILSGFLAQTQDLWVNKYGRDDIDDTGTALTGVDAGQHIFGGLSANTHLTLHANAGDGTGSQTGYIQAADNVRPTVDSTWSLGTTLSRWLKVWTDEITIGTMTITGGSITDSSGAIDFGNENLTTTGTLGVSSGNFGTLQLASGSITDTSGAIDFDDEDLLTAGTIEAGTLILGAGSITDSSGAIHFDDEDLVTTGDLFVGTIFGTAAAIANLTLVGTTLSSGSGDLSLSPGTGDVIIQNGVLVTGDIDATGDVDITGSLSVDNIDIDANTISSTDINGNIILDPNGTGLVEIGSGIFPTNTSTDDIGKTGNVWNKLWIDGSIGDGTSEITIANLLTFRAVGTPGVGSSLFWDGSKWVASDPDTEIDHGEISGLGDDDHTQYALLAGRAGGQSLIGGTAAGDDLTLTSTSNATKGQIFFASDLFPSADNTWDIGDATHRIVDLFMTGQAYGLRLENSTTAGRPSASAGSIGRLIWDTDLDDIFVDIGGSWRQITSEQYYEEDAINWDGSQTVVTYDVSSTVNNAKRMIWCLKKNSDDYEQVGAEIDFPTDTQVRVSVGISLAAGTYTLVGR